MTDADRVRLAVREGKRMLGPIERQRCAQHPTRWVSYRWIWPIGSDPSASEPQVVRGCAACSKDTEIEVADGYIGICAGGASRVIGTTRSTR